MDKKQAIFNENDIPYKELELIGISKKQIWSLDKANITALLSGKRTSLLDLSFHDNNGEEISMKGNRRDDAHSIQAIARRKNKMTAENPMTTLQREKGRKETENSLIVKTIIQLGLMLFVAAVFLFSGYITYSDETMY